MDILLKPDSLSLAGAMNHFVISSANEIQFTLRYADTGDTVVQHTYTPNKSNLIEVDLESIVTPLLSFQLKDISEPYKQTTIVRKFTVVITDLGTSKSEFWSFSVLRAGIDHFADSAANWLKANFLTWQPTVKPVTYYTPEFLTYYAVIDSVVKCRAYVEKDGEYASYDLTLFNLSNGSVWTVPVQYAIIAGKLNKLPSYYDIWMESTNGTRLTYIQRYYASDIKSEHEQWVLFENSLGGIDTFRAYGDSENSAKHTHNIAEIENDSEEYRVDTDRVFKKNTGHLSDPERKWLLDFFPSLGKYLYTDRYIRRIVVTESDVNWQEREMSSSYTFTYKYADARPYLNLQRSDIPADVLNIKIPDVGSFTVAPRLVELERLPLSDGALFPVQSPYSDKWTVTTAAAILDWLSHEITAAYKGDGSFGHSHSNMSLLESFTLFGKYLLINSQKISAGEADHADSAKNLDEKSDDWDKILRKDIDDYTAYSLGVGGLLTAEKGTQFGKVFVPGIAGGIGGNIDGEGNGELKSLRVREFLEATEYRHNRVSINVGNQWRAPGGGIIEDAIPDTDLNGNILPSGTIILHLEDGEIGAVDYDDICQGIFHDSATIGNNSKDNFDDSIGNFRFAGFFSSYFRITEIIDVDTANRNSRFRYTLRNDDKWSALYHPCAMMTFVAYGNFTKKDRQNSRYSTLTYERYLQNVNDWTFTQSNIAAQFGDLSNLNVFGLDMTGYSAYLDNVYFSGTIQQIEKAPLRMEIENPGGGILASGESTVINCRVLKGFDYVADDDLTWEILRDTGDADADAVWTQKQKVKDFAGSITLSHSSTYDDLSINPLVKGTLFTFIAHSKNGSTVRASIILRPPEEGEKGEDAILVSISQSGVIRNGQGNIILYASVFKGGDDITDKYIPEQFSWIRDSGDADFDAGWNRLHKDYGNRVALTAEDVRGSAVFSCELESE